MQELTDKKIIEEFKDKINDENVISDIFDCLEFDCKIRSFIDSSALDKQIKKFYNTRDIETLTKIVNMILKGKKESKMDENALLMEIIKYIDDNIAEDFTIEQLAKEFHISYYYLCHFFNKKMGQSITKYRTSKRLEKSIKMLIKSDMKVSDIATACGFDNVSYFSETFIKYACETPSEFRKNHKNCHIHDFYEFEDMLLMAKMDSAKLLSQDLSVKKTDGLDYVKIHNPGEEFGYFLHEAAIIEFEGVLYASWYNCREKELVGITPIVERRSYDKGKTWTEPEIICKYPNENIIYCPPVYGICDGKLYMLINEMVGGDLLHALDLYVFNKETDKFEFLWSRPIPFKLNTNVISLPNGKLLLPGRIAEMDGFPNTPAVLISDSGKIDGDWRLVKVAEDGMLPDGDKLVHPETTVICVDDTLYMFNRNDRKKVPLLYISKDYGESWTKEISHDIPYVSTKLYGGNLSDGRRYLICNVDKFNRSKLAVYFSEKGDLKFNKQIILKDCDTHVDDIIKCHYPAAHESDGKLYIIATADYNGENLRGRGAILFTVDLKSV